MDKNSTVPALKYAILCERRSRLPQEPGWSTDRRRGGLNTEHMRLVSTEEGVPDLLMGREEIGSGEACGILLSLGSRSCDF